MILLDTNYLIRVLVQGSAESEMLKVWVRQGKEFCTSAICWYEFISGPVDPEGIQLVQNLVGSRILQFTKKTAEISARLFNEAGRGRRPRVDCMIATTALEQNYGLATSNYQDFSAFQALGLELV